MTLGIVLISLGIVSIAFVQSGRRKHPRSAICWALANAAIIAAYTLVDGAGARASGNAASYVSWLLFLEGIPFEIWGVARRGKSAIRYLHKRAQRARRRGACSPASCDIVLWAITHAP